MGARAVLVTIAAGQAACLGAAMRLDIASTPGQRRMRRTRMITHQQAAHRERVGWPMTGQVDALEEEMREVIRCR